jgi:hypothetical protein
MILCINASNGNDGRGLMSRIGTVSQYEAGFMSTAHTDEDIEKTITIADEVLSQL